ncbi:ADP-ribosylglycohydrolase family protein [Arthrobacter sp. NA-172]|uniref:ADP-ribosylglycohydrolase family protein n=1 Tax=Arthrobacter sp. NA-172 TaxID=3367524 RepID=UPI003754AC98
MYNPATSAANDLASGLERRAGFTRKAFPSSARLRPPMRIENYAERVLGCWRGKAVGGTLGQSFEGLDGPIEADFYFPVPNGMVPNDDLDVQVVYAAVIAVQDEPRVDRFVIAEAWREHLRFPWNEYGVGKRNLAEGILPPHTGSFDNWFAAGEGAVIRTELWACLAPGEPRRAAAYAYEDACFDHSGDGIWAAVFMAALQSLAFVESDVDVLLDRASELLPVTSKIRQVVQDTRAWVAENESWHDVLGLINAKYANGDFTDTRPNTGYVVLGFLASGGDFEKAILITNGCGGDTDSSTASLGALLAIMEPGCIPARWLAPIGDDLVLNKEVVGVKAPATILQFTDEVIELRSKLTDTWPDVEEVPFDPDEFAIPVTVGWASPYGQPWGVRDASGLSPEGTPLPEMPANATRRTVPGTLGEMEEVGLRGPHPRPGVHAGPCPRRQRPAHVQLLRALSRLARRRLPFRQPAVGSLPDATSAARGPGQGCFPGQGAALSPGDYPQTDRRPRVRGVGCRSCREPRPRLGAWGVQRIGLGVHAARRRDHPRGFS